MGVKQQKIREKEKQFEEHHILRLFQKIECVYGYICYELNCFLVTFGARTSEKAEKRLNKMFFATCQKICKLRPLFPKYCRVLILLGSMLFVISSQILLFMWEENNKIHALFSLFWPSE